ncbi:hypothetical protein HN695_06250 [Candidatus Woesearchaeota archaeon]|jgi:hypothetical protein|nr:hypothetical protein [Candidatus Woesearchaeota archaeon]MBT5272720.1 hypothetical protein [Candidatus Woesearchaeota archaeon]MBT6040331.1 hypothetical protein [Candidatus Woesearchaeota archaeon]MBT6337035.1 hypothetical protein [Candidatus Woesearchaeota archaeon]MBT7927911.1 hypothetical protein [Candidatus Woesearchaeota archaeon]
MTNPGESPGGNAGGGFGSSIGGLFSQKKSPQQQVDLELGGVVRDVTRRLKVLEERLTTDRKNIQLNQQNVLAASKKVNVEIKNTYLEINELKKELSLIKEQIAMLMTALKETASKEDVKTMEKYVDLWEPLNFVTKREVESLIRRIINEK